MVWKQLEVETANLQTSYNSRQIRIPLKKYFRCESTSALSIKEERSIENIPPVELYLILGHFLRTVTKSDVQNYEPDTLTSFHRSFRGICAVWESILISVMIGLSIHPVLPSLQEESNFD